ncbi:MAG: hypothetical protein GY862_12865 [Gammaproteobacteria bacterium]|nr:hypothetical protein [Gammaproteobacteria bacterium]
MKDSLESFTAELANLRHYIEGLELESQLHSLATDGMTPSESASLLSQYQKHTSNAIGKRQFDYNSIIICIALLGRTSWDRDRNTSSGLATRKCRVHIDKHYDQYR